MTNLSIVDDPVQYTTRWFSPQVVHQAILDPRHAIMIGDLTNVPEDTRSREFAEWLTLQYRMAMAAGAQMAVKEMKSRNV